MDKQKESINGQGMKETLYMKIHGNSDNDYPHGNKHKEGNNWEWKKRQS